MGNEVKRMSVFLMTQPTRNLVCFTIVSCIEEKNFTQKLLCVPWFHWFAFIGRDLGHHQIYYCQMKLSEWNSIPGTSHRPISINSEYLFYVSQAGCRNRHFRIPILNMKIYKSENVTECSQHFEMVHGLTSIWSNRVACRVSLWNLSRTRRNTYSLLCFKTKIFQFLHFKDAQTSETLSDYFLIGLHPCSL